MFNLAVTPLQLKYFFVVDLLILAEEYCEQNLEKHCIQIIKRSITVSNIFLINKIAIQYNKTVTASVLL